VSLQQELIERLANHEARIGVMGLGYVGLPLAVTLHEAGARVLGFDEDPAKIESLAEGRTYLHAAGEPIGAELLRSERFEATGDLARLSEVDALCVCVPTPITEDRKPDLTFVLRAAQAIGANLRAGQLIVLESTTYPGTTREAFLPALLESQTVELVPGQDVFIAYSPERVDPGRIDPPLSEVPKLVGGVDDASTEVAVALYASAFQDVIPVVSAEVAEAAKLLENTFRAVNIALVNELKTILEALAIDTRDVVDAASTKPFGFMAFEPGPGLGGHCLPIDPFYLSWAAQRVGVPARFIELAGIVNTEMPIHIVDRLCEALRSRGHEIEGARVLVMGLAYKPDVDDTRESPSFELIQTLRERGAEVDYSDPHVPRTVPVRRHDVQLESIDLTPASIASYDAILVATHHSAFDFELVADHAQLVIDTRGALRPFRDRMGDRLVPA
jgi:UDP-N-acetyl-D-glucosamine dehydrogenase